MSPVFQLCFFLGGPCVAGPPARTKPRVGDGGVRSKKQPRDYNGNIGLLGEITYRESRSRQLGKASAAGIYLQQATCNLA